MHLVPCLRPHDLTPLMKIGSPAHVIFFAKITTRAPRQHGASGNSGRMPIIKTRADRPDPCAENAEGGWLLLSCFIVLPAIEPDGLDTICSAESALWDEARRRIDSKSP